MFVSVAWLPKATVQAAIGGEVLDMALANNASDLHMSWGKDIVTLAVLAILVTAPIGAIGINIVGPRWLTKDSIEEDDSEMDAEKVYMGPQ